MLNPAVKKLVYFLPVIVFVLLGIFLFSGIQHDPSELPSALIDKPLPGFELVRLEDGKSITDKDMVGKAFLLNVWATWCVSCRMEHPYLMTLSKQGVLIASINYKDDGAEAKKWLNNLGNPYFTTILDKDGSLGLDLGVSGAPETFLVDKEGIIRYKRVGVIDERVWQEELAPIYASWQAR